MLAAAGFKRSGPAVAGTTDDNRTTQAKPPSGKPRAVRRDGRAQAKPSTTGATHGMGWRGIIEIDAMLPEIARKRQQR